MSTKLLSLTNDGIGNRETIRYIQYNVSGSLTAVTSAPVFTFPEAGEVVSVVMSARTYTATSDRTLSVDAKKVVAAGTATSILTTLPAFAATAGAASVMLSSATAGTGITAAVIKSDDTQIFAAGNMLTVTSAIAGSNGTIGTDLNVTIGYKPYTV